MANSELDEKKEKDQFLNKEFDEKKFNNAGMSDEQSILLNFEKNDLDNESNALVGATFSDDNSFQSVKIRINGRTRTQTHLNLKKVWRLLQI